MHKVKYLAIKLKVLDISSLKGIGTEGKLSTVCVSSYQVGMI